MSSNSTPPDATLRQRPIRLGAVNRIRPASSGPGLRLPEPGPSTPDTSRPRRHSHQNIPDVVQQERHVCGNTTSSHNMAHLQDVQTFQRHMDSLNQAQIDLDRISVTATTSDYSPTRIRDFISLSSSSLSSNTRVHCFKKSLSQWFTKAKSACCAIQRTDSVMIPRELVAEDVAVYLDQHPNFLHDYLIRSVPLEVIESLHAQKLEQLDGNPIELLYTMDKIMFIGKDEFMQMLNVLQKEPSEKELMWELTKIITKKMKGDTSKIMNIHPTENRPIHLEICKVNDQRNNSSQMMLVPILGSSGQPTHVINILRSSRYDWHDIEVAASFMVWGSLALNFSKIMSFRTKERELTSFLLQTVRAIFEHMVSLDEVIKRILKFVQTLVDADRASLFLVDYKKNELVSTVFDQRLCGQDFCEKKEIRIPITRGIAGHVATTGNSVNISDAYSDSRFNRTVDEATGYRTTSILCMPVNIERRIIGVVQMVNKRGANKFCLADEKSFNMFSTFFALALHHAKLYDTIARKEQKYKVALEVLSYHNTCRESDVIVLKALESHPFPYSLNDFYLNPFALDLTEKCRAAMIMFDDLFNMQNFESDSVARLILTVKKNYRDVPYHNFHHGWSVAQTMYTIVKHDAGNRFSEIQRLALFVASLCHDLDHRGYTNKYMSETASPLATMYTTSTLEHHHFNTFVIILQQEGHNIFSRYTSRDYKTILGLIRSLILATDLAAFFPNLGQLKLLYENKKPTFDWKNEHHAQLAMAISMTGADLSASAKPWEVQMKTVEVIFQEFYDQGDREKEAGREPLSMMDRNKPEEQPASQVGFITQICLPCYDMLQKVLPITYKLHEMASKNLEIWAAKAAKVEQQKEEANQLNEDIISVVSLFSDTNESGPSGIQMMITEKDTGLDKSPKLSDDSWKDAFSTINDV